MATNFWHTLPRPIIGLSPMDGVTDAPFRYITKKYGQPDIIYTEFASVEGLCHGAARLLKDFLYDQTEHPIIGQLYGTTPKFFRQTAIILAELGFDGIDINMGCPAKNVAHLGAGAALIKTPKLAQEIIRETQAGVQDWLNGMTVKDCPDITPEIAAVVTVRRAALGLPPVETAERHTLPISIKTRIGYDQPVLESWLPNLLECEPDAIALHGRTLKQQYGGQASWEAIGQAAQLVHHQLLGTLLLGNGDLKSREDALQHIQEYGTDGALLGRAAMGKPFAFRPAAESAALKPEQLFAIAVEHAKLYEQTFSQDPRYNFLPMRKHLGWYVHDIPGAAEIRQAIYRSNNAAEFVAILAAHGFTPSDTISSTETAV